MVQRKRSPARRKRKQWGGKRAGSGRPALFPGERVKMTIKITKRAKAEVDKTVTRLEPEHGALATESAAVEHLIRQATGLPTEEK